MKIEVEGDKALIKKLDLINPKRQAKLVERALKKSAKPIYKTARSLAPVSKPSNPKGFKKRIAITTAPLRSGEIATVLVKGRAPHSHLIEWGTDYRRTENGANRGFSKGQFVFSKAYKQNEGKSIQIFQEEITKNLERIWHK